MLTGERKQYNVRNTQNVRVANDPTGSQKKIEDVGVVVVFHNIYRFFLTRNIIILLFILINISVIIHPIGRYKFFCGHGLWNR